MKDVHIILGYVVFKTVEGRKEKIGLIFFF